MLRLPRFVLIALLVIQCIAFAGCAAPPVAKVDQARTRVILLPDEDGKVGAVLVSSSAGEQRITAAYDVATVGSGTAPERSSTSAPAVDASYRPVIAAHPPRPVAFTLYFEVGKTRLTPKSRGDLPALFATVAARKPTEITVYGHCDSIGSDRWNNRLSELRAQAVARLLREQDPTLDAIEVKFLGDREPLFPAPDNVPEPRNRRAEVVVL